MKSPIPVSPLSLSLAVSLSLSLSPSVSLSLWLWCQLHPMSKFFRRNQVSLSSPILHQSGFSVISNASDTERNPLKWERISNYSGWRDRHLLLGASCAQFKYSRRESIALAAMEEDLELILICLQWVELGGSWAYPRPNDLSTVARS